MAVANAKKNFSPDIAMNYVANSILLFADAVLNLCPDVNTDPHIVRIIAETQNIDRCLFGCYLGIPKNEVLTLQKSGDRDHSAIMIKIFECWNRKTVDLTLRTWGHILAALKRVSFDLLASEIEKELCVTFP